MATISYAWFWLPIVCVFTIQLQTAECIRCWECNSHYDRNCADPFANETFALTDCDQRDLEHLPHQKATVCRKIVQKVRDDYRFVRGCGWLSNEKEGTECFKRAGTFNVLIQYCSCDRDGCNAALPQTTLAPATLVIAFVIAFVIFALN